MACTCSIQADTATPPTVILPEHPKNLLLAMPSVPQEWELVHSRGRSELYGTTGPVSLAVRQYSIPRRDAEGQRIEPGTLELVLTDFASQTEVGNNFRRRLKGMGDTREFHLLKLGGVFNGFLRQQAGLETGYVFQGVNGGRLMLQATFHGFAKTEVVALLESLPMDSLRQLGTALPTRTTTGWTFPTFEVDELDEEKDRESKITIHRPKPGDEPATPAPFPEPQPSEPTEE